MSQHGRCRLKRSIGWRYFCACSFLWFLSCLSSLLPHLKFRTIYSFVIFLFFFFCARVFFSYFDRFLSAILHLDFTVLRLHWFFFQRIFLSFSPPAVFLWFLSIPLLSCCLFLFSPFFSFWFSLSFFPILFHFCHFFCHFFHFCSSSFRFSFYFRYFCTFVIFLFTFLLSFDFGLFIYLFIFLLAFHLRFLFLFHLAFTFGLSFWFILFVFFLSRLFSFFSFFFLVFLFVLLFEFLLYLFFVFLYFFSDDSTLFNCLNMFFVQNIFSIFYSYFFFSYPPFFQNLLLFKKLPFPCTVHTNQNPDNYVFTLFLIILCFIPNDAKDILFNHCKIRRINLKTKTKQKIPIPN